MAEGQTEWSVPKKLLALFVIIYSFLYIFPFPFDLLPYTDYFLSFYEKMQDALVLFAGKHIYGLPAIPKIEATGSGDTTSAYLLIYINLLFSFLCAILAFIPTRSKQNYITAYNGSIIYIRYYVAFSMLGYGLVKMMSGQFPSPSPFRLEERIGDMSPMGLLWTFMGYSKTYISFTGLGEVLGGGLLLFRRTTVLGCLVTIFIMANVVMLNLCYDVPVKQYSIHLFLFVLIILAPYMRIIFDFFLGNKPVTIYYPSLHFVSRYTRIAKTATKCLALIAFISLTAIEQLNTINSSKPQHNLDGTYHTISFISGSDTLPPLTTDTLRWATLMLYDQSAKIQTMADSSTYYQSKIDTMNRTIELISFRGSSEHYLLKYNSQQAGYLTISGVYQDDTIEVILKKKQLKDYRLMKRSFRWISEYPYNR